MNDKTKGRLYVAVCIACLITCAVLILSIFFEKSENSEKTASEIHTPQIGSMMMEQKNGEKAIKNDASDVKKTDKTPESKPITKDGEMVITQEYASAVITALLPEGLPLTDVDVAIEKKADNLGSVSVGGKIKRADFCDYLEMKGVKLGIKEKLMMSFLGKNIEFLAAFDCETNEDGKIDLKPNCAKIDKKEINLSILPSEFSEAISLAVSETFRGTGFVFSKVEIRNGAFALIK